MHILIFSGGLLQKGKAIEEVSKSYDKAIAVDSGASHALSLRITPDILVGDLDSIDTKTLNTLRKKNVKVIKYPREKDQSDTEIALEIAIEMGATKISILAGISGDRIDHILANILLPIRYNIPIYFIDKNQVSWIAKGPNTEKVEGRKNDLLSLIPLSPSVIDLQSNGLKYALKNESLFMGKTRGVSNELSKNTAEVRFSKGILLFTHTLLA
jgi:thiamine pyrophosphokinase